MFSTGHCGQQTSDWSVVIKNNYLSSCFYYLQWTIDIKVCMYQHTHTSSNWYKLCFPTAAQIRFQTKPNKNTNHIGVSKCIHYTQCTCHSHLSRVPVTHTCHCHSYLSLVPVTRTCHLYVSFIPVTVTHTCHPYPSLVLVTCICTYINRSP